MKKILFIIFYMIFLVCFNTSLIPLTAYGVFENFKNFMGLEEEFFSEIPKIILIVWALLNILLAYLISRVKIDKKYLLIPPIPAMIIKIILSFKIFDIIFSTPEIDEMGEGGFFVYLIIMSFVMYVVILDIVFYLGLGISLAIRRKNENKKFDA